MRIEELKALSKITGFRYLTFMGIPIRIGIIALACVLLSVPGVRADTYYYTGPVLPYGTILGSYITVTMDTNASIANLDTLTEITGHISSLTFDFVYGTTVAFSVTTVPATEDDEVTTDAEGNILSWDINIYGPSVGYGADAPYGTGGADAADGGYIGATTENLPGEDPNDGWGLEETNDFANSLDGVTPAGVWVDVASEPGVVSQLLLGLLGLGLFLGVKRYRGNRLAREA